MEVAALDHVLPRAVNPEIAVDAVSDWYGLHVFEGAVDFSTNDEAPVFVGTGTGSSRCHS